MSAGRLSIAAVGALLLASGPVGAGAKKAYLQGYDALGRPGVELGLRAKAEKASRLRFRPDLEDEVVRFHLAGRLLGSAKTNDDGVAAIRHTFNKAGRYTVTATLGDRSKYAAEPGSFLVAVHDANTRFVVCDVDHTLAGVSAAKFVFKKNEDVPALPGSVEVLTQAAKHYAILYVTARDDAFMNTTRGWMALRKFPPGPVFFWDFGRKKTSHRKYKTREIAAIKEQFPHLVIGLGDKASDARAYLANGLRAIIIHPERDDDLPRQAVWVKSWSQAEPHLLPRQ